MPLAGVAITPVPEVWIRMGRSPVDACRFLKPRRIASIGGVLSESAHEMTTCDCSESASSLSRSSLDPTTVLNPNVS